MTQITGAFVWLAVGFTGLAVAMVSQFVVGREWAPAIVMCAGWSYALARAAKRNLNARETDSPLRGRDAG